MRNMPTQQVHVLKASNNVNDAVLPDADHQIT